MIHQTRPLIGFIAIVLIVLCVLSFNSIQKWGMLAYENVSYVYAPSSAKAFEFGGRHFDAMRPSLYDIDRAEYFFSQAAEQDPSFPYVYHELARIDFLKGNFPLALSKINVQISMHDDSAPNSYYIRGLIEGYMGLYKEAIADYAKYLESDPGNWAALNDYAWVLIKANEFQAALHATEKGLKYFPDNPWLLNSRAIALYELGEFKEAHRVAQSAGMAAAHVTKDQWLTAYPGNDPRLASTGIETLQKSIQQNIHRIDEAMRTGKLQ